jgi:hypothetical protein
MESFALFLAFFFAQTNEPVSEADAAAEEKRRATLPYDCLGGVCLNAQASSIPEKIVQVVGHNFRRRTKVCKGRVVEIRVIASWTTYPRSEYVIPGANTHWGETSSDIPGPGDIKDRLEKGLETLGWEAPLFRVWGSPKVQGVRLIEDWSNTTSENQTLSLVSEHPRKDELCAYQTVQGL